MEWRDGSVIERPRFQIIGIGSGSTVPYVVERIQSQGAEVNKDRIFLPTGSSDSERLTASTRDVADKALISLHIARYRTLLDSVKYEYIVGSDILNDSSISEITNLLHLHPASTGFQSKELIIQAGLTLGDVDQHVRLDVTIDGADEWVDRTVGVFWKMADTNASLRLIPNLFVPSTRLAYESTTIGSPRSDWMTTTTSTGFLLQGRFRPERDQGRWSLSTPRKGPGRGRRQVGHGR